MEEVVDECGVLAVRDEELLDPEPLEIDIPQGSRFLSALAWGTPHREAPLAHPDYMRSPRAWTELGTLEVVRITILSPVVGH